MADRLLVMDIPNLSYSSFPDIDDHRAGNFALLT